MANRQTQLMNEARGRASFNSKELTNIIYGGPEAVKEREIAFVRIERELQRTDLNKLPDTFGELDRTRQYMEGLRFGKAMVAESLDHKKSAFESITPGYRLSNGSPFGLHVVMFIPSLKLLASPEQLAYWLPLAESYRIIGTYCQTELGHGSFVRGLETTATFDPQTDEFVLHSPTTSATKYWPGGLGYSASHAILRSLDDYAPLPGLELGDIGLKLGNNSNDNGYAVFSGARIPRAHLLARHAQVARDGTYRADAAREKLLYGAMLFARRQIVGSGYLQLAQAVTIALRYSVVREQGVLPAGHGPELPILAFRAQNQRLLTLMARAFALLFAARDVMTAYDVLEDEEHNPSGALASVHAVLAGLKAYATQTIADGVEDARKCCGGNGYLAMSGFAHLVTTATVNPTLEGDFYVMYQQTARLLVKHVDGSGKGGDPRLAYLLDNVQPLGSDVEVLDPKVQLDIFRHRAARLVRDNAQALRLSQTSIGFDPGRAWNTHMIGLISAARGHIEYGVLQSFVQAVHLVAAGPPRAVLQRLCSLFALTCIDGPHGIDFVEDGYLSAVHLRRIRAATGDLLDELLPDAVALTDAWNFSDASLESALGCRDGNIYERIMSWTRQVPLNVATAKTGGVFRPGFEKYIRPILKGKL